MVIVSRNTLVMKTEFAIAKAGGRDNLARLLGVETITTYHWFEVLPPKHVRYLRLAKPKWFKELEAAQAPPPQDLVSTGAA